MKIRNTLLALFAAGTALFSSCDNDIDLVAPYREIGVIYGLIDPSDTIHIVRIQKAFLGEGNANVMAQVTDSTYYPDILDVQMQRIKNGAVISSFPLTRYIADNKEPGEFPVEPNILYKTGPEIIFRDSDYKLVVKNTQSGHEFSATTPIVDSLKISKPSRSQNSYIQFSNPQFPYKVEYLTAKNGKITTMTIRFKYTEEIFGSGVPGVDKFVDWVFPSKLADDPDELEPVIIEIEGEDFYKFVGESVPVIPNAVRYNTKLDFIFDTGGEFLANYLAINQSTSSILTTTPYYSNVTGGTGIFSSRYQQVVPDKLLDTPSKAMLSTSPYTSDLGFQ